jgi:DNA-binding NtrC family response regulator
MKGTVLVVDDEPLKRVTLQIELTEAGYTVYDADDPKAALRMIEAKPVDVVVTDLRMPGMDGLAFLEHVKARRPETHVIMMTAYGTVDTAVAAMKRGACDYITKPFRTESLVAKIEPILNLQRGLRMDRPDAGPAADLDRIGEMIAVSQPMRRLFEQIRTVADSGRTILIEGESGTGKELVAGAIHQASRRRNKALVKFSFAALQPTVIESELLGHEKGAFTGAVRQKPGRFELADGGTLFLDEVDDIPANLQVKLLRVIEQQEFERVGGEAPVHVDVRLVCATKKDLRQLVADGTFRQDLFYRLHVIHLTIPPLRERMDDVPVLANHFVGKHAGEVCSGQMPVITPHALDVLMRHDWPGNVRELEHVIERAMAFCDGRELRPEHIPVLGEPGDGDLGDAVVSETSSTLTDAVSGVESKMIASALRRTDGNQARAAHLLGIPRTTLRDKIAKYSLSDDSEPKFESGHG